MRAWFCISFSLLFLVPQVAFPKTKIRVGLVHFPPFIQVDKKIATGAALDLIQALNGFQQEFVFEGIVIAAVRKISDFKKGEYDLSMFDSPSWGWKDVDVAVSKTFATGGEVYIAFQEKGRDESFFTDFKNKKMIGVRGYHYAFADFNSDHKFLHKNFQIILGPDNAATIKMVLSKIRGDIGVITKSFLHMYLKQHPNLKDKILVSKKYDQKYNHKILLRKGLKLSIADMDLLLEKMKLAGVLQKIWKPYGIALR